MAGLDLRPLLVALGLEDQQAFEQPDLVGRRADRAGEDGADPLDLVDLAADRRVRGQRGAGRDALPAGRPPAPAQRREVGVEQFGADDFGARPAGHLDVTQARLYAGLAAALVAWRTRSTALTLLVGMGLLLGLRAL